MEIKTEQIPRLPEEIIEQILSRLPVKSLLKFRCVSHSWCSLIGSKKFIKTHLENSTKTTDFTHHRIISKFLISLVILKHCSLHSLLYEPVTNGFPFDFGYTTCDPQDVHVVGCCNGLICILVARKHFYLCNPSTRKFKKLPEIDDKMIRSIYFTKYGFGYDEFDDDYKVFGALSVWHGGKYQATGKIYSVKTNSWRRIDSYTDPYPFDRKGIFASGKLYWLKSSQSCSKWHIVSFDLKSEVYGIVEQPDIVATRFAPGFGALEGRLYVLFDN